MGVVEVHNALLMRYLSRERERERGIRDNKRQGMVAQL